MYQIKAITNKSEFSKFESEWNCMVCSMRNSSPFMYHQWFSYTYDSMFSGAEPFVLSILKNQRIVGFLPLGIFNIKIRNIELRTVGFIDNPDIFVNSIITIEDYGKLIPVILNYFYNDFKNWDILLFDKVPEYNPLYDSLQQYVREYKAKYLIFAESENLFLTIDKPWDEYYNSRSKNFRKSLRGVKNRLERNTDAVIEQYDICNSNFQGVLEELLNISSNTWKNDVGVSLSMQPASKIFFKNLTEMGLPNSKIILYLLRINGTAAATEYHIRSKGIEYALRADFHNEFTHHSPGTFLDFSVIKDLFNKGIHRYELGPGLNPYKLKWTEASYKTRDIFIVNSKLKANFLYLMETNIRKIKKVIKNAINSNRIIL